LLSGLSLSLPRFCFIRLHSAPASRAPEISYSQFISEAEAGKVASVVIEGSHIRGLYRDGKGEFQLIGPSNDAAFLGVLQDMGTEVQFKNSANESTPGSLLGTWAPLILLAALWFFMIRQMKRRNAPPGLEPPEPKRF
jgi:cell division protease FtsH